LVWKDGKVLKVVIKSNLGGNCRIRVPNSVKAQFGLTVAKGNNPNFFYQTEEVQKPIISDKAKLNKLNIKETYLYDFQTKAGQVYTITL